MSLEKRQKYNTHLKSLPNILPYASPAFINNFMCKTISKFMALSSEVKEINLLIKLHNKNKINVDRINIYGKTHVIDNIMIVKNVTN